MAMASLRLPAPGRLPVTGAVDAIERYHRPGIGAVLRRRLLWARQALPAEPVDRALEIGYGSGIFLYTLAAAARQTVGIDVHHCAGAVQRVLVRDGVPANVLRASGTALPFGDESFDVVVVLATLEFIPDPAACLHQVLRVLRPGGRAICLRPRSLRWADWAYRALAGFDPERDFQGGRHRVALALQRLADSGVPVTRSSRPRGLPAQLAPYELVTLDRC
ncbi:MAG TPA: class I SAM-dependent methyltransferase [Gemmatimonadales bacterium]|nr:class I SAM-dependent methyltransferase [Gemmatimonadales bacterium]